MERERDERDFVAENDITRISEWDMDTCITGLTNVYDLCDDEENPGIIRLKMLWRMSYLNSQQWHLDNDRLELFKELSFLADALTRLLGEKDMTKIAERIKSISYMMTCIIKFLKKDEKCKQAKDEAIGQRFSPHEISLLVKQQQEQQEKQLAQNNSTQQPNAARQEVEAKIQKCLNDASKADSSMRWSLPVHLLTTSNNNNNTK